MIRARDIELSENTVFVFGDNLERRGLGGQARVARPFVPSGKTLGIPTKRKPATGDDAYFADRPDEVEAVRAALAAVEQARASGKKVIFFPGIGEGLAELPRRSPAIYAMIQKFVRDFT